MTWQILIALSVLLFSVSTILQKILLRNEKTDPMAFSIFFQLVTGIIIGVFGFVTVGLNFPNLYSLMFNLGIMAVLYALGNIFLFKSLQKIDASVFTVIFSGRALFTILASSFLIKEGLNLSQYFGTILVLASIALVTLKTSKFSVSKFEFFALVAAMCFGFETTNDRLLLTHLPLYSYVFIAFVVPAIITMPIYPKSLTKMVDFLKLPLTGKMLLLCVIYAAAAITFFQALQVGSNSSQIASLNLTTVIVTVILSIILLKERSNILRKVVGAIISFVGVLLLG